jgi:hypothetical protein
MRGCIGEATRKEGIYLGVVLGAAALGAAVAQVVWGQWFQGALGAGCLAALLALPSGVMESNWDPSQPFNPPTPPRGPRDSDRG